METFFTLKSVKYSLHLKLFQIEIIDLNEMYFTLCWYLHFFTQDDIYHLRLKIRLVSLVSVHGCVLAVHLTHGLSYT
jgi:hypothetical protein